MLRLLPRTMETISYLLISVRFFRIKANFVLEMIPSVNPIIIKDQFNQIGSSLRIRLVSIASPTHKIFLLTSKEAKC